jgi:hypothetical protein
VGERLLWVTFRKSELRVGVGYPIFSGPPVLWHGIRACFRELNPRTPFAPSWHHEFIAAIPGTARKGRPSGEAAVRDGRIRRLIINVRRAT